MTLFEGLFALFTSGILFGVCVLFNRLGRVQENIENRFKGMDFKV